MSFHQCGGNVGDACDIPLPRWALEADNIWYKDQNGQESKDFISNNNLSAIKFPFISLILTFSKILR